MGNHGALAVSSPVGHRCWERTMDGDAIVRTFEQWLETKSMSVQQVVTSAFGDLDFVETDQLEDIWVGYEPMTKDRGLREHEQEYFVHFQIEFERQFQIVGISDSVFVSLGRSPEEALAKLAMRKEEGWRFEWTWDCTHGWPQYENETLGPCGCIDYHMADCPIRTG